MKKVQDIRFVGNLIYNIAFRKFRNSDVNNTEVSDIYSIAGVVKFPSSR